MTENQLFPMSADIFDTSSNSSNNTLKYDLYAFGLGTSHSNSNSSIALFDTATLSPNATTLQLNICTSLSANCSSTTTTPTSSASSSLSSGSGVNDISNGNHKHSDANVMLTNAITIPRSNNPNQSHNFYGKDTQIHNPSTTRTLHMPLHHHLMQQNNHQMMSSQQQQHSTLGVDLDHGQQQQLQAGNVVVQQHFGHASRMIPIDLADLGLDALDASSLSPTLLQDVSLNASSPLVSISAAAAASGNLSASSAASTPTTTGFYAQDASPLTSSNNCVVSVGTDVGATLMSLSTMGNTAGTISADDLNSSLIQYEVTANSNTMWSDIGNAIIATKNEPPFNIEDDYIFPLDKTELHSSDFPDINDDNFLEVIGTIDDLIPSPPSSQHNCGDGSSRTTLTNNQNEFILSPSHSSLPHLNSPLPSPGGPPMELLQQKLQLQQRNSGGGGGGSGGGGGGGAIHHSHHNHHNSSSPYDLYHSTPNKQHQLSSSVSNTFSPNSQMSHSPLQINSITPPPPPHTNRSQFQQHQQQGMIVKSRNMQELLKKGIIIGGGFPMSPDCNTLQGQSNTSSHLLLSSNALSPSSASSGFGSATGGSASSTRKLYNYQQNDASVSRLSSSAPTHLGLEHIWMRREPRQHLLSTGSLAEAESFSSLSTGSVLSPDNIDFSQEDDDDDASTDYNSDQFDDFSSDGSDNEDEGGRMHSSTGQLSSSKGKERFFWQYNVQAKGPKGKRLVFQTKVEDPHVLNEVTDPVFSPNCSVRGIKHSGKARKGDGNDLTPNPRKLHSIGKELDKLNRTINDMTPVSELPFNVRPKSRKEKNKLASRACRLKKKAQHEANKIKLFGLEIEHKRLLTGIADMKQVLALKYRNQNCGELSKAEVDQKIENIYKTATSGLRIAGETTDFVNKVLENIKSGVPNGGLEELKHS